MSDVDTSRTTDVRTHVARWVPLWPLFVHVTVGTAIFLIICAPTVGLVHWLSSFHISQFLIFVLQFAEYTLLIADSILYLLFLAKLTWRVVKAF